MVGFGFPTLQALPLSVGAGKLQRPWSVWERACAGAQLQLSRWRIMSGIQSFGMGIPSPSTVKGTNLLPQKKESTKYLFKAQAPLDAGQRRISQK